MFVNMIGAYGWRLLPNKAQQRHQRPPKLADIIIRHYDPRAVLLVDIPLFLFPRSVFLLVLYPVSTLSSSLTSNCPQPGEINQGSNEFQTSGSNDDNDLLDQAKAPKAGSQRARRFIGSRSICSHPKCIAICLAWSIQK